MASPPASGSHHRRTPLAHRLAIAALPMGKVLAVTGILPTGVGNLVRFQKKL